MVTATSAERAALIAAAPPAVRLVILLCSDLLIRSGTALKVAPAHWDRERGSITIRTKHAATVELPCTAELTGLLEIAAFGRQPGDPTPFVQLMHGNPNSKCTASWFGVQFRAARERAGIIRQITPHDFRRTTAVRLYEETHDLRVVKTALGHRELRHTFHYLDHQAQPPLRALLEQIKLPKKEKP